MGVVTYLMMQNSALCADKYYKLRMNILYKYTMVMPSYHTFKSGAHCDLCMSEQSLGKEQSLDKEQRLARSSH